MKILQTILLTLLGTAMLFSCDFSQKKIDNPIAKKEIIRNGLIDIKNLFKKLDKTIIIDKTTPKDIVALYPTIDTVDGTQYRIDAHYDRHDYKSILIFSFEEGVLNSIVSFPKNWTV